MDELSFRIFGENNHYGTPMNPQMPSCIPGGSSSGSAGLGQNGKLTKLDLSTKKLTGLVPKSLCFAKKLNILILLNNFLFGSLPNDLGECYTLERVRLEHNYLTGQLNLSNNRLSGTLPASIEKFPDLEILLLHGNRFSSEIPPDIGKLKSVLKIDLSVNNFLGTIPPEIVVINLRHYTVDRTSIKLGCFHCLNFFYLINTFGNQLATSK
ncbi:hypothetical protein S83_001396, partial [Arachis hypogaea]